MNNEMTLQSLRREIRRIIEPVLGKDAENVAKYLICDVLDMSLSQMINRDCDVVDNDIIYLLREKSQRLAKGEPLQYVTGVAYFKQHKYFVNGNVLIPRPETEQLVDILPDRCIKVLDIGTGSGCIAIEYKLRNINSIVSAIDVSCEALDVAKQNAQKMGADIAFYQYDILRDSIEMSDFDMIVSNPPYVVESEKRDMERNVIDYEPEVALYVSDNDPLIFYKSIAQRAIDGLLKEGGVLYFEINDKFAQDMVLLLSSMGFSNVFLYNDMFGKTRFISASRS